MLTFFSFAKFQKLHRLTRNLIHDLTLDLGADTQSVITVKTRNVRHYEQGEVILYYFVNNAN